MGAGITYSSDPAAEYREAVLKAAVLAGPPPRFWLLETMRYQPGRGIRHRERLLVDQSGAVTLEHAPLPVTIDGPVRLAIDPPGPAPDLWCRHKTTRRDRCTRAAARHPQAEDVILTDPHGRVLETSTANIAVLLDGRWWTPPAELGCLPGVERARLLDAGLLSEAELSVEDLPAADGLAVLNSLRGWRPAELITQPQP